MLNNAAALNDLSVLPGNRSGLYSIRVNDQ